MFANLKNKILEETGSDLSQLAPKLSGVQQRVAAGLRTRRSGSNSSLSALDEEPVGLEDASDNVRSLSASFKGRVRDSDIRQQAETLSREKVLLEEEKAELVRRTLELTEALKEAEGYKKKAIQYQEDLDQLEGFQTQEMAKIKHLLLEREQQLTESNLTLTKLQAEVSRLRGCQEELSNTQDELNAARHSSQLQSQKLAIELEESEAERHSLAERLERTSSLLAAATSDEALQGALTEARDATQRRLEETRLQLADVKAKWGDRITALETQLGRLSLQAGEEGAERRRAEQRLAETEQKLTLALAERDQALEQLEKTNAEQVDVLILKKEREASEAELQVLIDALEGERTAMTWKCLELEEQQKSKEEKEERLLLELNSLKAEQSDLQQKFSYLESDRELREVETRQQKDRAEALAAERDTLLLRNASLSQQGELACRELQEELSELRSTLDIQKEDSAKQLEVLRSQLDQVNQSNLSGTIAELQEQLSDKNKTIRVLQQRLADMKKTLQRELKCPSQSAESSSSSITSTGGEQTNNSNDALLHSAAAAASANSKPGEDVNHAYLKHVLIKFLTSREYEAKHLTRAVATLLHFTPEEERLLRETLEWKMSWFGTRPNLGIGQTAKTIPPS